MFKKSIWWGILLSAKETVLNSLKSLQNKKGLKIFQLPAVEKDTEKWAAGKFLGPSYFEATL